MVTNDLYWWSSRHVLLNSLNVCPSKRWLLLTVSFLVSFVYFLFIFYISLVLFLITVTYIKRSYNHLYKIMFSIKQSSTNKASVVRDVTESSLVLQYLLHIEDGWLMYGWLWFFMWLSFYVTLSSRPTFQHKIIYFIGQNILEISSFVVKCE